MTQHNSYPHPFRDIDYSRDDELQQCHAKIRTLEAERDTLDAENKMLCSKVGSINAVEQQEAALVRCKQDLHEAQAQIAQLQGALGSHPKPKDKGATQGQMYADEEMNNRSSVIVEHGSGIFDLKGKRDPLARYAR